MKGVIMMNDHTKKQRLEGAVNDFSRRPDFPTRSHMLRESGEIEAQIIEAARQEWLGAWARRRLIAKLRKDTQRFMHTGIFTDYSENSVNGNDSFDSPKEKTGYTPGEWREMMAAEKEERKGGDSDVEKEQKEDNEHGN